MDSFRRSPANFSDVEFVRLLGTAAMPADTASELRPAVLEDISELILVTQEAHVESRWHWTHFDRGSVAATFKELIEKDDAICLVAQRGEDIVAFAACKVDCMPFTRVPLARITCLFALRRYRGVLALRLLHKLLDWAKEKGVLEMRLDDDFGINSQRNADLFTKLGLEEVGRSFSVSIAT